MNLNNDNIKKAVREHYSNIAKANANDCGCCCGNEEELQPKNTKEIAKGLGYSDGELASVPEGSNMGLGCGNPLAIASLKIGDTVLDLGSGGGFDCFLAARKVGDEGMIIGVDMSSEMISLARKNANEKGYNNVDFRLGEIENLPVANESIDVIISNCVINLSPDKARVFQEAYRVLKKGGILSISDIVTTANLPNDIKENLKFYTGCVSGAATSEQIKDLLVQAGFINISISPKDNSRQIVAEWAPGKSIDSYITSVYIQAEKN